MEHHQIQHVVLGAGAIGSATAYHLARRGEPVLLIEQFQLGHNRGSSHGPGRIIRHSYADPLYARRMPAAFRAWRDLEAEAGQTLYVRTGGLSFGPAGIGYLGRVAENLKELDVPHRRMSGAELRRGWPAFEVPNGYEAVYEPDAGCLPAARIVALQIELARRIGGSRVQVLEDCPIQRIDLEAARPTLIGPGHRIEADRLIVTAGAWTGRLLPALADQLRPTRQQVLYLRPADAAPFARGRFPVFIFVGPGGDPDIFYGMPDDRENGVKVARHGGPDVEPDFPDRAVDPAYREEVRRFLRGHIPALAEAPIGREEVCLYTVAPSEHFLTDLWPGRRDVVVASPCSGHGFKFSNLMGRLLADLAQEGRSDLAADAWRIAFNP